MVLRRTDDRIPAARRWHPLVLTSSTESATERPSRATTSARVRTQLINAVNHIADASGVFQKPLSATELIEGAQRRTGLTDFGDRSFDMPLEVLAQCYEEEANLSAIGRMAARWDALRFLSNLLRIRDAEKNNPAILDEAIDRPIFITGMPRSGSTFLHALLCEDEANRAVRCWETIDPYPAQRGRAGSPERRQRKVDRQLAIFAKIAPELPGLHPISACSPQECTEIMGHVFRSLRFDTTHHVPSYRLWLDSAGHLAAYRFHKRFLKHLQHRNGSRRWILKCPDHVFALKALRDVYPDACFIFLHRDPLEVLASVARLTEVLRRPFTREVDRLQIGRQVSERWAHGAAMLVEAAESGTPSPERVCHINFRRFVENPLLCVAALYERFGLTSSREVETRLRRFITERPNGGYDPVKARLDEYGLDAQVESRGFRDYMLYFGR